MMKGALKAMVLAVLAALPLAAEPTKAIFNPFTSKLDYITKIDTNTIIPGTGVTITGTNGTVTVTATGGGGSSSLAVNNGTSGAPGVNISSPTAGINFDSNGFGVVLQGASTAFVTLNPSATYFIQNTSSLQSGATFYVSSGTVKGPLNVTSTLSLSNGPVIGIGSAPGHNVYSTTFKDVGVVTANQGWDNASNQGFTWSNATQQWMNLRTDTGLLNLNYGVTAGSATITTPLGSNSTSLTVTQNDTTNNPNLAVFTTTGTGSFQLNVNGRPSGGEQNQIGGMTINGPPLSSGFSPALLVIRDSTTNTTNGAGLLEIWEQNSAHNAYLLSIHGTSTRNSDEPIRFDGPTYGIDEVSLSTDSAHGLGKWKVISIANQAVDLQIASSRAWDDTTFENLAYAHPLSKTDFPPGIYLQVQSLANDSAVLSSSDTAAFGFTTQNNHTIGLTGPLNTTAAFTFALPGTANNLGQVLYQSDNGRGNNYNARSWAFTTGGSTGQVLTYQSGSAPTWTTASSGGSSTLGVGTGKSSALMVLVSSPTSLINLDQSQFGDSLTGASTSFVTIAYSTNNVTAAYTAVSTDSFITANCASACTVTLPTAVGISGKVYMITQAGTSNVTVGTTSNQTISGGTTALMNQQYSELDIISDGSNWWVK